MSFDVRKEIDYTLFVVCLAGAPLLLILGLCAGGFFLFGGAMAPGIVLCICGVFSGVMLALAGLASHMVQSKNLARLTAEDGAITLYRGDKICGRVPFGNIKDIRVLFAVTERQGNLIVKREVTDAELRRGVGFPSGISIELHRPHDRDTFWEIDKYNNHEEMGRIRMIDLDWPIPFGRIVEGLLESLPNRPELKPEGAGVQEDPANPFAFGG